MIYNMIIIIISIILEIILNLYINIDSYLVPLFTLLSLIFVYPYFKNSKKDFFVFSFILGFVYDLVFTNFYILNSFIFLFVSIVIYYFFKKFNYKIFNIIFLSVILISIYNFALYIIFDVYKYNDYTIVEFLFILKHFFIINIIYIISSYLISNKLYLKNII